MQQRHLIIEHFLQQHPQNVAVAAVNMWEKLATELIAIVGEGGFRSLYARTIFFAQPTFPWLDALSVLPQSGQRFAQLKSCLEGQTPEQAGAANRLILITFTDILAALIGEQLTASILRAAWGDLASIRPSKEFKNE